MKKEEKSSKYRGMGLTDNTQASSVKPISSDSEQYDMGRCKYYSAGSKGYPSQAIQGDKMKY